MTESEIQAGPSNNTLINDSKVELASKVKIFQSSKLDDILDYSIIVSNEISMARDQLANERNWLTWFRISCTLVLLGFTILVKFRLPDNSKNDGLIDSSNEPIGYTFVAIGFLCFFLGIGKYFKNQNLLIYQATDIGAGWGSLLVVAVLFSFICTILILTSYG